MIDEQVLAAILANPSAYGVDRCTLCGEPPAIVSVFVPTESFAKRIGQPEGKSRVVVYALCFDCHALPDVTTRVEEDMLRTMTVH